MNVIAFLSQKGGSGKTTLSVHTAVAAEATGERVCVIDADPQESATAWASAREAFLQFFQDGENQGLRVALRFWPDTFAGCSTGISTDWKMPSVWCGNIDDWAAWSSPPTASTPPAAAPTVETAQGKTAAVPVPEQNPLAYAAPAAPVSEAKKPFWKFWDKQ